MTPGAGTAALPKATVKLQPGGAKPLPGRPGGVPTPSAAPMKRAAREETESFYEEKDPEAGLVPLSAIAMVFAIVLLVVQMLSTDVVTTSSQGEASPIMVPEVVRVDWEVKDPVSGEWRSSFDRMIPEIPQ
jgi:hypothetical protein